MGDGGERGRLSTNPQLCRLASCTVKFVKAKPRRKEQALGQGFLAKAGAQLISNAG